MQDIIENTSTVDALSLESPEATAESEIEQKLSEEIASLWSAHNHAQAAAAHTKDELKIIRLELGQRLHETKKLVSRPGRGGGWSSLLSAQGIPRATADRLVARYQQSLDPEGNRLGDATKHDDPVEKLLKSLLPRLRRVLTTEAAVFRFIDSVARAFGLPSDAKDGGLLILASRQNAVVAAPQNAATMPETLMAAPGFADAASDHVRREPHTALTRQGNL